MSIEISAKDVLSSKIQKTPNQFLKVPIDNYLEAIGVEPVPPQVAIINAINNPKYRFIVAAIARRLGKTYIANIIGQVVTLVPNSHVLIMSPNYSLSQISFELQRKLIKNFALEVEKDNAKDKIIELSNGSTVRMGSVSQVDSCVGRSYDLIIFDEAALTDGMEAFTQALRPTLDKDNSKAIFISTPRGKNNWFSVLYDRGYNDEFPEWVSVKATYKDNPRMSQDDVDEAIRSMTDALFAQEFLADFSIYEGKIWNLKSDHIKECPYSRNQLDIIAGMDVGFKDPMALCIIGHHYDTDTYWIMEEFQDNEMTTEQQAEVVNKLVHKWDIDFFFIDSAAAQTRWDFAQLYDISTAMAKKSVLDGLGYVGSLVENGQIYVDPSCTNVINAFDRLQWDPRETLIKEKPLRNEAIHMADAIRYAIYSHEGGLSIV